MRDRIGDKARLRHILNAISEIDSYTQGENFEMFAQNSMMKFASVKQLEIIGEAANHLSDELKQQNPDVAWREIIGLRNILIHEYFGIDNNIVWDIIKQDIPQLKMQVLEILRPSNT